METRIDVVGALIRSDQKVLIAQRASGDLAGKWEFPGGKVELNETKQQALAREIHEELGVSIAIGSHVASVDFEVGSKRLCLHCFWASLTNGVPEAVEHHRVEWVAIDKLLTYDLAPADIPIAKEALSNDW